MKSKEEQELQHDKIVELLNEISSCKQGELERNNFGKANMLGRCYELLKTLHITNTERGKDLRMITDHKRLHFAGQAMQALIISDGVMGDTVAEAFMIADSMVKYGKTNSKTKCTGDGTGNTSTEDSN